MGSNAVAGRPRDLAKSICCAPRVEHPAANRVLINTSCATSHNTISGYHAARQHTQHAHARTTAAGYVAHEGREVNSPLCGGAEGLTRAGPPACFFRCGKVHPHKSTHVLMTPRTARSTPRLTQALRLGAFAETARLKEAAATKKRIGGALKE